MRNAVWGGFVGVIGAAAVAVISHGIAGSQFERRAESPGTQLAQSEVQRVLDCDRRGGPGQEDAWRSCFVDVMESVVTLPGILVAQRYLTIWATAHPGDGELITAGLKMLDRADLAEGQLSQFKDLADASHEMPLLTWPGEPRRSVTAELAQARKTLSSALQG